MAATNIREAIRLLDQEIGKAAKPREQLLDLRSKAHRHMAGIEAERDHYDLAHGALSDARLDAEQLPEPERSTNLAQLEYTKAYLLVSEIDRDVGPEGVVRSNSDCYSSLQEAVSLCGDAERVFTEQADLERAAKAAQLRCRIIRHEGDATANREAEARLRAIELKVARNLRILKV